MDGAPPYPASALIARILRIVGVLLITFGGSAGVMSAASSSPLLDALMTTVKGVVAGLLCLAAGEALSMLRDIALHASRSAGAGGLTPAQFEQVIEDALKGTEPAPMSPSTVIHVKSSSTAGRPIICTRCGTTIRNISRSKYKAGDMARCPACREMTVV